MTAGVSGRGSTEKPVCVWSFGKYISLDIHNCLSTSAACCKRGEKARVGLWGKEVKYQCEV